MEEHFLTLTPAKGASKLFVTTSQTDQDKVGDKAELDDLSDPGDGVKAASGNSAVHSQLNEVQETAGQAQKVTSAQCFIALHVAEPDVDPHCLCIVTCCQACTTFGDSKLASIVKLALFLDCAVQHAYRPLVLLVLTIF